MVFTIKEPNKSENLQQKKMSPPASLCQWLQVLLLLSIASVTTTQQIYYLAQFGNDNNSCSSFAPCRTIDGVYSKCYKSTEHFFVEIMDNSIYFFNFTYSISSSVSIYGRSDQYPTLISSSFMFQIDGPDVTLSLANLKLSNTVSALVNRVGQNSIFRLKSLRVENTFMTTNIIMCKTCQIYIDSCLFNGNFIGYPLFLSEYFIQMKNTVFMNNLAEISNYASIIQAQNGNAIVDSCKFVNNRFMSGGALFFKSNFVITNSSFERNMQNGTDALITVFSSNSNSSIYVASCLFESNIARVILTTTNTTILASRFFNNTGPFGGALFIQGDPTTKVIIQDSSFLSNIATNNGGALQIETTNEIEIVNCTFDSNTARGSGGAISFFIADRINITRTSFTSNTARSGGAIAFFNCFSKSSLGILLGVQIQSCNFLNNVAIFQGGAITMQSLVILFIQNSILNNNRAGNAGGAIHATGTTDAIIFSPQFYMGIEYSSRQQSYGFGSNSTSFLNNTAEYGGAIYINSENSRLLIQGNTFLNNSASVDGGAIYSSQSSMTYVNGSLFQYNQAGRNGGCLSLSGTIRILQSNFSQCIASSDGGAVNLRRNTQNSSEMQIRDASFQFSTAKRGGAAFCELRCDFFASNFTNSTAEVMGGAIYMSSRGTINNSRFSFNRAMYGGALALHTTQSNVVQNPTFDANYATAQGAAIFINDSSVDRQFLSTLLRSLPRSQHLISTIPIRREVSILEQQFNSTHPMKS